MFARYGHCLAGGCKRNLGHRAYVFPLIRMCFQSSRLLSNRQLQQYKNDIEIDLNKLDVIFVDNLSFHGYHGKREGEKMIGQKFLVSFQLYTMDKLSSSDKLEDVISYGHFSTDIIRDIVENRKKQYDFIETMANDIAQAAFEHYNTNKKDIVLYAIRVTVKKPQVCFTVHADCSGVQVFRTYKDYIAK